MNEIPYKGGCDSYSGGKEGKYFGSDHFVFHFMADLSWKETPNSNALLKYRILVRTRVVAAAGGDSGGKILIWSRVITVVPGANTSENPN